MALPSPSQLAAASAAFVEPNTLCRVRGALVKVNWKDAPRMPLSQQTCQLTGRPALVRSGRDEPDRAPIFRHARSVKAAGVANKRRPLSACA